MGGGAVPVASTPSPTPRACGLDSLRIRKYFGNRHSLCHRALVRKRGKITTAALIEGSYGTNARVLSAAIIALASFSIVSYQLRAMGVILNATTGFNLDLMTLISCVVIIIATVSGGLSSVVKIDAFSVCVMLVGIVCAFAYIFTHVGWF
mgnify:CR=1 FL=1